MNARPSSTTGAVSTSSAPRGKIRRSSRMGQATISSAGIDTLLASLAHAYSARATSVCRCSADKPASRVSPISGMPAAARQDDTAADSHAVPASSLASAASMRCLRKTPSPTSYVQKPRPAYSTYLVLLTTASWLAQRWAYGERSQATSSSGYRATQPNRAGECGRRNQVGFEPENQRLTISDGQALNRINTKRNWLPSLDDFRTIAA